VTRPMQIRDVNDPIARIVRDWAAANDVPAIRYTDLIQQLQSEVGDLVVRAQREAMLSSLLDAGAVVSREEAEAATRKAAGR
jgi:hypothetical protein